MRCLNRARWVLVLALIAPVADDADAQSGVEVKLESARSYTNPDPDLSVILASILLQGSGLPESGGLFGVHLDRAVGPDGIALVLDPRWSLMPPSLAPRQGDVAGAANVFWRPVMPEPGMISFSGAALFYTPEGNEDAVITMPNALAHAGRHAPLAHPALRALGIELFLLTPDMMEQRGDNAALDAILDQKEKRFARYPAADRDPDIALVTPEPEDMLKIMEARFVDGAGNNLRASNGLSSSATIGYVEHFLDPEALADVNLQLSLRLPGTVIEYPFAFEGVPLPCAGDRANPCR